MEIEKDEIEELIRIICHRRRGNEQATDQFFRTVILAAVEAARGLSDHYQLARIYLIASRSAEGAGRDEFLAEARRHMAFVGEPEDRIYTLSHKILLSREIARQSGLPEDEKVRADMEARSKYVVCGRP